MLSKHHKIGIGLRTPHYRQILDEKPDIDYLEIHPENFMFSGGLLLDHLTSIRHLYPLSFHAVGLSLGSADGISKKHLKRIKRLITRFEPILISDHLSWSGTGGIYLPDLLPIPYNDESLNLFANHIDEAQNYLQRTLLIENPSTYLEYNTSTYSEAEFLTQLIKRTDAKLLLDINNIYVSCCNHGWDPIDYLNAIPYDAVQEIHLAGHSVYTDDSHHCLLLDTHDNLVCQEVWDLYRYAMRHINDAPTLIEWDSHLPDLEILLNEARKTTAYLDVETDSR